MAAHLGEWRLGSDGFGGGGLLSPLCEELLRVLASDTAEEFASVTSLGNAVHELDTTGEGLVGNLVVGDVLGENILQLSSLLRVLCDESSGLLLGDDEGEGQFSVEFVGDTDNAEPQKRTDARPSGFPSLRGQPGNHGPSTSP
jgi:hypothetical protein